MIVTFLSYSTCGVKNTFTYYRIQDLCQGLNTWRRGKRSGHTTKKKTYNILQSRYTVQTKSLSDRFDSLWATGKGVVSDRSTNTTCLFHLQCAFCVHVCYLCIYMLKLLWSVFASWSQRVWEWEQKIYVTFPLPPPIDRGNCALTHSVWHSCVFPVLMAIVLFYFCFFVVWPDLFPLLQVFNPWHKSWIL